MLSCRCAFSPENAHRGDNDRGLRYQIHILVANSHKASALSEYSKRRNSVTRVHTASQALLGIGQAFSLGQWSGEVVFIQKAESSFNCFFIFWDNQFAVFIDGDVGVMLFWKLGVEIVGDSLRKKGTLLFLIEFRYNS